MPIWLRAALFVLLVPGTVAGWLPFYLARGGEAARGATPAMQAIGAALFLIGWAILLWCVRDFVRRGRGTPAPYDPPRALVTDGLYRFVRNPMYVGALTAILGVGVWYWSVPVFVYAAVMALVFHVRVVFFEEPVLARMFGAEFTAYRERVRRWLPTRPRRHRKSN